MKCDLEATVTVPVVTVQIEVITRLPCRHALYTRGYTTRARCLSGLRIICRAKDLNSEIFCLSVPTCHMDRTRRAHQIAIQGWQ
jgi:hypothetical protein